MEKQVKNSRQRNAVLKKLCATKAHPTAFELYEQVREEIPNISLATIYRNLNMLCEDGKAWKLTADGADHYDATVELHYHFICTKCQRVYDVDLVHNDDLDMMAQQIVGGKVIGHNLMFYGICKCCNMNLN